MTEERILRDFLNVLFKRKWTILLIVAFVVIGGLIGNAVIPMTYEATAKLIVQKARAEMLLTPVDLRTLNLQLPTQDLNSEVDIMKSRVLLEQVVTQIGLERLQYAPSQNGAPKGSNDGTPFLGSVTQVAAAPEMNGRSLSLFQPPNRRRLSPDERAIIDLDDALRIRPVESSNVILVRYRHADPAVAADVVNALVKGYLDRSLQLRRRDGAYAVFDEQRRRAEARMLDLDDALARFDEQAGFMSPQTQREASVARLVELQAAVKISGAEFEQARARVRVLEASLAATPSRIETLQETKWNEVIDDLKKRLAELEVERVKLLGRLTERHRSAVENAEQIQTLRSWLAREAEQVPNIARSEVNPNTLDFERELVNAQATLASLQAKNAALTTTIADFRTSLVQLNRSGLKRDQLVREIKATEETYLLYKRKAEEARVDTVLDDSKLTNVKVAEWAAPPLEPAGLRRGLLLALLTSFAMVAGVGTAFGVEALDHSVRTPRDVQLHLGLPVLASIPDTKKHA